MSSLGTELLTVLLTYKSFSVKIFRHPTIQKISNPTPSRLHVNCDYCGAEMRKKKVKEHTTRVHGKNVHLKERHESSGQQKPNFGKRPAMVDENEQNENIQQISILEVDLYNSTDLYTDEGETEGKPECEPEPETESFDMASFVRALSES